MEIVGRSDRSTEKGPKDWFSGTVWLDEIGVPPPPSRLRVHLVTFELGTRFRSIRYCTSRTESARCNGMESPFGRLERATPST